MPKQDENASQMEETEEVLGMVFMTDEQAAVPAKPGEKALDSPAALVAPQGPSVLGWGAFAVVLVGRDHLDSPFLFEPLVEAVAVVGFVSDHPLGQVLDETLLQGGLDQFHFMRASTFNPKGERKTLAVRHCHDLGPLAPLGRADFEPPFFAGTQVPGQMPEDLFDHSEPYPALVSPVHGLVRRKFPG